MSPEQIIRLIDVAAAGTRRSSGTWGRLASGSGDQYTRLCRGHDITTRRAARIVQWLSDHWPAGAEWPADIPRPPPSGAAPAASLKRPNGVDGLAGSAAVRRANAPSAGAAPEGGGVPDPVAAVRRAKERELDALAAGEFRTAEAARGDAMAHALRLGPGGTLASPEALCLALGVQPRLLASVIERYRDGAPQAHAQPRRMRNRLTPSSTEMVFGALVASGDARFAGRATHRTRAT